VDPETVVSPAQPPICAIPSWIGNSANPLFLSGPSRSKLLKSLHLKYDFVVFFKSEAAIDQALQDLVHGCLDPTFRHGDSFPSLRNFHFCVRMTDTCAAVKGGMQKEALTMRVIERLPSVFGAGGRCDVDGWAAHVDVETARA